MQIKGWEGTPCYSRAEHTIHLTLALTQGVTLPRASSQVVWTLAQTLGVKQRAAVRSSHAHGDCSASYPHRVPSGTAGHLAMSATSGLILPCDVAQRGKQERGTLVPLPCGFTGSRGVSGPVGNL